MASWRVLEISSIALSTSAPKACLEFVLFWISSNIGIADGAIFVPNFVLRSNRNEKE